MYKARNGTNKELSHFSYYTILNVEERTATKNYDITDIKSN